MAENVICIDQDCRSAERSCPASNQNDVDQASHENGQYDPSPSHRVRHHGSHWRRWPSSLDRPNCHWRQCPDNKHHPPRDDVRGCRNHYCRPKIISQLARSDKDRDGAARLRSEAAAHECCTCIFTKCSTIHPAHEASSHRSELLDVCIIGSSCALVCNEARTGKASVAQAPHCTVRRVR